MTDELAGYALDFPREEWTPEEREVLEPFVTNLDSHMTVLRNLPPELVGALCSRASRAPGYLVRVLWNEYLKPLFADPESAKELRELVAFHRSGATDRLAKKGRAFYAKWLAAYGDDSIAQMTGTHVVFWGISQVAMKVIQDQRIGLEPIEKSTRYVQFANKVGGKYLYYTPRPDLERLGLLDRYVEVMDHLFDTYRDLQAPLIADLKTRYDEKESVVEKKAFDTLRGLLPMATLGQVAFRGNAQALEHWLNRTAAHPLGELRYWAAVGKEELNKEISSLLLRLDDPEKQDVVARNQSYLAGKRARVLDAFRGLEHSPQHILPEAASGPQVDLVEWDPRAEEKILAGILYPELGQSWETTVEIVEQYSPEEREKLLRAYVDGRTERWQKLGRAFENVYLRFEIAMNIGAYRDLQRHRMLTQQRQLFTTRLGYDLPPEVVEAGLADRYEEALTRAHELFLELEAHDPELAQYVVPLAYRVRFQQFQNLRNFSWAAELRTGSQGHPDYRVIEQEKYRLIEEKYPLLASVMLVDKKSYPFARRGTEERIEAKEKKILKALDDKAAGV
jgi:thymidylate synthase ThyX